MYPLASNVLRKPPDGTIAENKAKEYAKAEKATLEHYGEDVFNAKAIREYF